MGCSPTDGRLPDPTTIYLCSDAAEEALLRARWLPPARPPRNGWQRPDVLGWDGLGFREACRTMPLANGRAVLAESAGRGFWDRARRDSGSRCKGRAGARDETCLAAANALILDERRGGLPAQLNATGRWAVVDGRRQAPSRPGWVSLYGEGGLAVREARRRQSLEAVGHGGHGGESTTLA
jgi:hypothetical protein